MTRSRKRLRPTNGVYLFDATKGHLVKPLVLGKIAALKLLHELEVGLAHGE